ncbi:MAG: gas vesicle protein [Firmicutes bacterium]|nr:gas vesicle protein [Bacillota bacterium]MCL5040125.1 gas vesicle protein [Bacillota bacterium]
MALQATKGSSGTLVDVIDRLLDKGLVINADILVSLAGVELLGIKIRAALASLDTAARYGLEFPSGTNYNTQAWRALDTGRESCPQCGKTATTAELLEEGCPWCGWKSAKARLKEAQMALPEVEKVNVNPPEELYNPDGPAVG